MIYVIEVKNLTKTFKLAKAKLGVKTFEAIKGTSFSVEKGEIFGILGPNGAGKTTTLEIIEGLKQQSSGTVTVLGLNNIEKVDEIKQLIGIQLQQSQYLHHLSLGELLDLFASLYNCKSTKKELLEMVGLTEKEHEEFKNLSGGQKQRFTIATSLVHKPEILFLDEPTTGLDPHARREMWKLVKTINTRGVTIVITTHFMEEAEFLCNRVAIMDSGKILEIDEPRKLIDKLSTTTQISFFTSQEVNQNLFSSIPEVYKLQTNFPKTILEISNLDKISSVLEVLKNSHINFSGFTVKTASLEDVYLKLTGKEYENE